MSLFVNRRSIYVHYFWRICTICATFTWLNDLKNNKVVRKSKNLERNRKHEKITEKQKNIYR